MENAGGDPLISLSAATLSGPPFFSTNLQFPYKISGSWSIQNADFYRLVSGPLHVPCVGALKNSPNVEHRQGVLKMSFASFSKLPY